MSTNLNFRGIVAALGRLEPITIGGEMFTGAELAQIVSVNPNLPTDESARTPQLIHQVGQMLAQARKDLEKAEIAERVWRYNAILEITTGPDALETAINMGYLAEGTAKPLSKTAAEAAIHTQPEYAEHMEGIANAKYVVRVLEGMLQGARARERVVYDYNRQGTAAPASQPTQSAAQPVEDDGNVYDTPREQDAIPDIEQRVAGMERTPIPAMAPTAPPPPSPPVRRPPPSRN